MLLLQLLWSEQLGTDDLWRRWWNRAGRGAVVVDVVTMMVLLLPLGASVHGVVWLVVVLVGR